MTLCGCAVAVTHTFAQPFKGKDFCLDFFVMQDYNSKK